MRPQAEHHRLRFQTVLPDVDPREKRETRHSDMSWCMGGLKPLSDAGHCSILPLMVPSSLLQSSKERLSLRVRRKASSRP